MRLYEITKPNIDSHRLLSETLSNRYAGVVVNFYNKYKDITGDYTIIATDVFDFDALNSLILPVSIMRDTVMQTFGTDTETYKIAEFLADYFSHFGN